MKIVLPEILQARNLLWLLSSLSQGNTSSEVVLDFSNLRRTTPACMTALAAAIHHWRGKGTVVEVLGLEKCPITAYLQRMDFLKSCEIEWPENFHRHDSKGRFVPVCSVEYEVGAMGSQIASCLAPGGDDYEHPMADLYDWAYYVFTEIANNIRQHSRGTGFAAAQVSHSEGLVRIALTDNGTGIRKSFVDAGYDWSLNISDSEAILKALEPRVSSKGQPSNEGVGLTLISELAYLTQAWLLIVSGHGLVRIKNGQAIVAENLPDGDFFRALWLPLASGKTNLKILTICSTKRRPKQGSCIKTKNPLDSLHDH